MWSIDKTQVSIVSKADKVLKGKKEAGSGILYVFHVGFPQFIGLPPLTPMQKLEIQYATSTALQSEGCLCVTADSLLNGIDPVTMLKVLKRNSTQSSKACYSVSLLHVVRHLYASVIVVIVNSPNH